MTLLINYRGVETIWFRYRLCTILLSYIILLVYHQDNYFFSIKHLL